MNTDLFLALLSMDAYNRPSVPQSTGAQTTVALVLPAGAANGIGNASVDAPTAQSDIPGDSFFAAVYHWNGQTVISYRGTDNYYQDPFTGWVTGAGIYDGAQAQDAVSLYKELNGNSATTNSNFILTGDSLGGGLAGFVGDIYGDDAVIFNNMPFEKAVANLYYNVTNGPSIGPNGEEISPWFDPNARQIYYNDNPIQPSEANIHGYAVAGEILGYLGLRNGQIAPVTPLSPGTIYPLQSAYNLHDIATLIVLLDAQENNDTTWAPVEGFVVGETYDSALAQALGIQSGGTTGTAADYYKMQMMIAYSAIDGGTYVYGDTGIASLFQDADQFGTMESANNLAGYLTSDPVESAIASIIVEYAGLLAINQDTNAQDEGVFTYDAGANQMDIDFSPSLWTLVSGGQAKIVGEQTLTDAAVQYAGGKPSSFQQAVNTLWGGSTSNLIELVAATTDDPGVSLDAAADGGITAQDAQSGYGAMLVAAGGTGDRLTGGIGNDLLVGGSGGDTFTGGTGSDLMFGGSGNDTFILGQGGINWVDGGAGYNTVQYNTTDPLIESISGANGETANGDPIILVVDDKPAPSDGSAAAPTTDYLASVQDIKLGSGANTVVVDSFPHFQSPSADPTTDLGATSTNSNDTVDFSQYQGNVYLSSAKPTGQAPNAIEAYANKNFTQDLDVGFTDFNTLILGNGDNVLNLQKSDDPYLSLVEVGNGNNTITSSIPGLTIDLGTGNNDVGSVAQGTIVKAQSSGTDQFELSADELITGSTDTDELLAGGNVLHGAVGEIGSESPWVVAANDVRYGINVDGDLVVQDPYEAASGGGMTFVQGYQGGPSVPLADQTDGIYVGLAQIQVSLLIDLVRPFNSTIQNMFKLGNELLFTEGGQPIFHTDPLVFDLTGAGIDLTALSDGASPMLDMEGTGFCAGLSGRGRRCAPRQPGRRLGQLPLANSSG